MENDYQVTPEVEASERAVFEAEPIKKPHRIWPWLIAGGISLLLLIGIGTWILIERNKESKVPQLNEIMKDPGVINTGVDTKSSKLPGI